jgi:broad specificity phosphatase PhoE
MSCTGKVIIVRHAERIDEVDMGVWREVLGRHRDKHMGHRRRCVRSESNDPHLTHGGLQQAEQAADHLVEVLRAQGIVVDCIYSSRLIRTVQTAHKIAIKLNVPIVLSSYLAESAAAVARSEGTFDFLSAEELAHFAPGTQLVEGDALLCDDATTSDNPNGEEEVIEDFLAEDDTEGYSTPRERAMGKWERCVHSVAKRHTTSVIVAHRETIRDLAPEFSRRKVPYCGLAYFDYHSPSTMKLQRCSDRDGTVIFPFAAPHKK